MSLRGKRIYIKFNHKRKWDILNFFEKLGEKDENFKIFLGNGTASEVCSRLKMSNSQVTSVEKSKLVSF